MKTLIIVKKFVKTKKFDNLGIHLNERALYKVRTYSDKKVKIEWITIGSGNKCRSYKFGIEKRLKRR